jgi:hypothetical protein
MVEAVVVSREWDYQHHWRHCRAYQELENRWGYQGLGIHRHYQRMGCHRRRLLPASWRTSVASFEEIQDLTYEISC